MSQEQTFESKCRSVNHPIMQEALGGIDNLSPVAEICFYLGVLLNEDRPESRESILTQIVGTLAKSGFPDDVKAFDEKQTRVLKAVVLATFAPSSTAVTLCLGLIAAYFNEKPLDAAEDVEKS